MARVRRTIPRGHSAEVRGLGRGWRRRRGERGAQSLEWLALGSFVATMMGGATIYARDHGGELGGLLLSHLRGVIGQ
jgi:hypothetical protein